jgi:serine protease Do
MAIGSLQWLANSVGPIALALAQTLLPALPAAAQADGCTRTAREIFAQQGPAVVEVFSLGINPYLVVNRVAPKFGTAFVTEDGHLVTNYHVIADAREIYVFVDDQTYPADVIGIDPTLDVAVLDPEVKVNDGAFIAFADGKDIAVGDEVYTIGFPYGLGETISHGLISGIGRVLPRTTSNWLEPYIQTDAAISFGNSGGPLVDTCGRLVGMVTAGFFREGANDIGFAIPVEVLAPIIDELVRTGKIARPWHGLYGRMVSGLILSLMGAPPDQQDMTGFLVETVEPGSAADRAGLKGGSVPVTFGGTSLLLGGDIITRVNGTEVDSLETALRLVKSLKIGDTISIDYLRFGTTEHAVVKIEERPMQEAEMDIYRTEH